MKNRKKKNTIFLLLILILSISIGYALLSTTLKINGLSNVAKNKWDIHWDNVANEKGAIASTPAYIKDDSKLIVEYEVVLAEPGDYYEFTVDAVNEGTLDGKIKTITSTVNDQEISTLPDYINYSVTYLEGGTPTVGDILKRQDSKTYKIKVEYDKNKVTPKIINDMEDDETYVFNYEVEYVQKVNESRQPVSFATDPWNIIAKAGNDAAKQTTVTNNKCGVYNVGDTKEVDLGDLGVHTVRIANCSTPAVCSTEGFSQTACGFVLEFTDIILERSFSTDNYGDTTIGVNTYGGWKYSDMRAYLNGTTYEYNGTNYASSSFLSRLPVKLQRQLGSTTVVSGINRYDSSDNAVTTDKLFLLAPHEVWESNIDDSSWNLTRQLDYYSINETTLSNPTAAVKHMGNSAPYWWLRSADYYSERNYYGVRDNGDYDGSTPAHQDGVSPAFKLK